MEKISVTMIEDDAFFAQIYTTALEAEGFSMSLAGNGEDGLKLIEREKPDLILLDILLPQMNGYEVLEKIKSDEEFSTTPVIMLSSLGQREDVEKAMQLGAARYLIKGHARPQDVCRNIKEILNIK